MRYFNTAGPCRPDWHYMIPALERLPEAPRLVDRGFYFVVHAPRQTGKTTAIHELARALTRDGRFAALYFSCEQASVAGEDYGAAQNGVLDAIRDASELDLPRELRPPSPWPDASNEGRLRTALQVWAQACPRPLVLMVDEIDSLHGATLVSVLRQLRAGYTYRPEGFPWSVALCGMRDVRDYKLVSGGDPSRVHGPSPFNVKVEALRLGDFSPDEVARLYAQHTQETGQPFTPEAIARSFELTQGQPWLVNALAYEIIDRMGVSPPAPITLEHVDQARERLVLARATHLDSLLDKLQDPRVRRVIGPLIAGQDVGQPSIQDDIEYARDLGLVARDLPVRVANPIYREVIVRVLAEPADVDLKVRPQSFITPTGRLDMARILGEFADFWKVNAAVLQGRMPYPEVASQLVLMAFLQRVVNGGGYVDREYGVGRGRIDLLVRWPTRAPDGRRDEQREAVELKVWRDGRVDPLAEGLEQLDEYLARLGLGTGVLVLFDQRSAAASPERRTRFERATSPEGRAVTVLRA